MFVCCECCVLSRRALCDELITRPEEPYRLWCVVVCDLETSRMSRPWTALGRSATAKKKWLHLYSGSFTQEASAWDCSGLQKASAWDCSGLQTSQWHGDGKTKQKATLPVRTLSFLIELTRQLYKVDCWIRTTPRRRIKGGGDKLLEKELTQHSGLEAGWSSESRFVLHDEEKNSSASTGV
jgi:hypothetical protein